MQQPNAEERMRRISRSRIADIENSLRIMKAEMYKLLTNYMYLSREDLTVYVDVTDDGEFILNVRARTKRFIGTENTFSAYICSFEKII